MGGKGTIKQRNKYLDDLAKFKNGLITDKLSQTLSEKGILGGPSMTSLLGWYGVTVAVVMAFILFLKVSVLGLYTFLIQLHLSQLFPDNSRKFK